MAEQIQTLGVSVFCQDMAMMLAAGIGPEEALGLLAEDAGDMSLSAAFREMEEQMALGANFTTVVRDSGIFPDYACGMIETGEKAGRLEQVLRSLSGYYERQDQLERQLKNAVIYPVTLLLMMCVVLALMVVLVLPVFVNVYENMAGALAQTSYRYITLASVISWVSLILVGVLSLLVLAGYGMSRSAGERKTLYNVLQRVPMTRRMMEQLEVSRLIDALSTFLSSGMDTDTSMEESARMVNHPALRKQVEAINVDMAEGKSLAQAFYDHKMLPPLYSRMLLSSARSGQLDILMGKMADVTEM